MLGHRAMKNPPSRPLSPASPGQYYGGGILHAELSRVLFVSFPVFLFHFLVSGLDLGIGGVCVVEGFWKLVVLAGYRYSARCCGRGGVRAGEREVVIILRWENWYSPFPFIDCLEACSGEI